MEKDSDMGQELLVNELMQGLESTQELWFQDLSSPPELLFNKIQSSFTNALSILRSSGQEVDLPLTSPVASLCYTSSKGSNQAVYGEEDRATFQKREKKSIDTRHVHMVYLGADPPDDGFRWRKYGQKEILGHKFPRSYYLCNHGTATGCPAKKTVQRSTEDSSILDIMYRGEHTCIQKLSGPPMLPKPLAVQSEDSIQAIYGKGHRATFQEREKQPMWIKQMCPVHLETDPPNDGYRWRRFAQEEIRGATLPM
ncbi:probable WRKY transcription factor 53 [Magnolia sinica]|uniref:probable WRKY transcription factor 53 n=1 Tax=Magnolia sinica TaxID=86752 RepID=UPI002659CD24|nr:probable WRKY transcription factor 53 [Magnolia sinica]